MFTVKLKTNTIWTCLWCFMLWGSLARGPCRTDRRVHRPCPWRMGELARQQVLLWCCPVLPDPGGMWLEVGCPESAVLVWPSWEAPEAPSLESSWHVRIRWRMCGALMGFVCKDAYLFSCPQVTQPFLGNWNFIYFSFNIFKVKFWGKFSFFLSSVKRAVLGRQAFRQPHL